MRLKPGDFLFVRLNTSPADGTEDVPVAWVTPPYDVFIFWLDLVLTLDISEIFPDALKTETLAIRDKLLGPSNLRSRTKPVDGLGGTAFERETKPTEVRGGRCYAFGMSHERQTWLVAPCKDGKVSRNPQEITDLRQDLLRVSRLDYRFCSF